MRVLIFDRDTFGDIACLCFDTASIDGSCLCLRNSDTDDFFYVPMGNKEARSALNKLLVFGFLDLSRYPGYWK